MGTRYRKSFTVAKGVKLNLGKKSVGMSIGGKYGGISLNSKTGTRGRVSAPGTGFSYSESLNAKHEKATSKANNFNATNSSAPTIRQSTKAYSPKVYKFCKILSIVMAAIVGLFTILMIAIKEISATIVGLVFSIIFILLARMYNKQMQAAEERQKEESHIASL